MKLGMMEEEEDAAKVFAFKLFNIEKSLFCLKHEAKSTWTS